MVNDDYNAFCCSALRRVFSYYLIINEVENSQILGIAMANKQLLPSSACPDTHTPCQHCHIVMPDKWYSRRIGA